MTVNISGFLTVPATCGVMGLLQAGTAFEQTILNDVNSVQASLNSAAASILNLPNVVTGILLSDVEGLANSLTAMATGTIANFIGHLTSQFSNLVNNLGIAVNQAAAQVGLSSSGCTMPSMGNIGTGGSSPCGNMQNLFGSIMGAGQALVNNVMGTLDSLTGTLTNAIGGVLSDATAILGTITGFVNGISATVSNIASMITSEVAGLAAAVTDMITFGAANALSHLASNPCSASVLQAAGSSALLGHLGL